MKNILKTALSVLAISLLLPSQSQVVNKDIEIIESFHSINVNARYTVYLKQSNETKIEVRALKEVLDISKFEVENGTLNIFVEREEKDKSVWEKIDDIKIAPKLDVFISMKEVRSLAVNGNGKIVTENSIASANLKVMISGSGDLEADIKGDKLEILNSGSGTMKLKGYSTNATLNSSGSGKIEAYALEVKLMNAKMTGSSSVEVNVKDELVADLYGTGSLKFKGDTKNITKHEYGTGKIERTY